jgi:hypothetical protein
MSVERAVRGGEHAVEPGDRAQLGDLGQLDEPAGHAELVLQRNALPERGHVFFPVEQKEVPDLVEVDLRARTHAEASEGFDAAQADGDVERIRELRTEAACGAARRAAGELVSLHEADVHARLGEMEGGARADHAAPDDDDLGGGWENAHRRTRFFRKNPRFAGRSARRRMRYGYQSGPNGVATSTL